MSPIEEQQIIALFIEARIKQEAARVAVDNLDLAIFRAGNPKFHIKLVEDKPLTPTPQTEEVKNDEKASATS